jgi:hypothetical protein
VGLQRNGNVLRGSHAARGLEGDPDTSHCGSGAGGAEDANGAGRGEGSRGHGASDRSTRPGVGNATHSDQGISTANDGSGGAAEAEEGLQTAEETSSTRPDGEAGGAGSTP